MKRALIAIPFVFLSAGAVHAQDAADDYYDPAEMEAAREALKAGAGGQINFLFLADRLEYQSAEDGSAVWEVQGWVGGDINRIWIKSEGAYNFGSDNLEAGELEILYGRAISPYFDLQVGAGQGLAAGPSPTYGVIGIQGLAPQWFEVNLALMVSSEGDVTADIELEYDLLLTQRLILQPRLEAEISMQDIPEYGIGNGLASFEAGLRLRFEIKRQFAPYLGLNWHRKLGGTADMARLAGENPGEVSFLVGLKAFF